MKLATRRGNSGLYLTAGEEREAAIGTQKQAEKQRVYGFG
jgi:hypothetical protein